MVEVYDNVNALIHKCGASLRNLNHLQRDVNARQQRAMGDALQGSIDDCQANLKFLKEIKKRLWHVLSQDLHYDIPEHLRVLQHAHNHVMNFKRHLDDNVHGLLHSWWPLDNN